MYLSKLKKATVQGLRIFKYSISNFGTNRPVEHAGTTAYFAIFSLVPILIIIISVFGYFAGDEVIREKLFGEITVLFGKESTTVLRNAIENYNITENSGLGALIGLGIFLVSATTLFTAVQNSINYIWRIQIRSNLKMSALNLIKTRFLSFAVILFLGLILLISLIIDASVGFLTDFLSSNFNPDFIVFAKAINFVVSLAVVSAVFALIYRFLPDIGVKWSASWYAAIITAILFALGKTVIGIIIGNSNLGVVYGAAGSFAIILVWIFFVSVIFYFGVELSYQYSRYYEHDNEPAKYARQFEIQKINKENG